MGMLWRMVFRSQPPWYRWIEQKLEPYDFAVRVALVFIIVISIVLLVAPSRTARLVWFTYVVSP